MTEYEKQLESRIEELEKSLEQAHNEFYEYKKGTGERIPFDLTFGDYTVINMLQIKIIFDDEWSTKFIFKIKEKSWFTDTITDYFVEFDIFEGKIDHVSNLTNHKIYNKDSAKYIIFDNIVHKLRGMKILDYKEFNRKYLYKLSATWRNINE